MPCTTVEIILVSDARGALQKGWQKRTVGGAVDRVDDPSRVVGPSGVRRGLLADELVGGVSFANSREQQLLNFVVGLRHGVCRGLQIVVRLRARQKRCADYRPCLTRERLREQEQFGGPGSADV